MSPRRHYQRKPVMKIDESKLRIPSENIARRKPSNFESNRTSLLNETQKGDYYNLKIEDLIPYHKQVRALFDDEKIEDLALTIRENGIRQPLTVIKSEHHEGKYEIISGERRFKAAQKIGLRHVPCIILTDTEKAEEISIIENTQRENLHPVELGKAYMMLYTSRFCKTQDDVARKVGVPRASVSEYIKYAELPEKVQNEILTNKIFARNLLRKVSSQKNENDMLALINNIINEENNLKKNSIVIERQKNVLQVSILDGNVTLKKSKISRLSQNEKTQIKEAITKFLDEIK